MLKKRLTLFITLIVGFFLAVDFAWYSKSLKQIKVENSQKQTIIFLKLKVENVRLLKNMIYLYDKHKKTLLKKHKIVFEYLKKQPNFLKVSLDEIHKRINKNTKDNPYNIYITDKNLTIRNTTFKNDLGFNLAFAKETFLKNHKKHQIGISYPLFETITKTFFSYTSSFLTYKDETGNILQISYRYEDLEYILYDIKNIFETYTSIKEHKYYLFHSEILATEINLKEYNPYKLNSDYFYLEVKNANNMVNKLKDKLLHKEPLIRNDKHYIAIYTYQKSLIFGKNIKILYYLVLEEEELEQKIRNLNVFIFIITIIGILVIIFLTIFVHKTLISPIVELQDHIQKEKLCTNDTLLLRKDEIGELFRYYNRYYKQLKNNLNAKDELLEEKNKFMHNAIHEINTPLTIISTNNSLRDMIQGECEEGLSITPALKTLKNTIDDLNFSIHHNKTMGSVEEIDLKRFLQERVNYFDSIVKASDLRFKLLDFDECVVEINKIELTRLIDNNISNGIKYSFTQSTIEIGLKVNNSSACLSFKSRGKEIKDTKKIFKKFAREDEVKGGFGLGLNMVKLICDNNQIKIEVNSKESLNQFSYFIKCHTKVIST